MMGVSRQRLPDAGPHVRSEPTLEQERGWNQHRHKKAEQDEQQSKLQPTSSHGRCVTRAVVVCK